MSGSLKTSRFPCSATGMPIADCTIDRTDEGFLATCRAGRLPRLDSRRVRFLRRRFSAGRPGGAVRSPKAEHRQYLDCHAALPAGGGHPLRDAGRSLRPADPADDQCHLFLDHRAAVRIRKYLYPVPGAARSIWDRDGWGVGRWSVAGDGTGAAKMARRAVRDTAERIFDRLSARCDRFPRGFTDPRMAMDVLAGRAAGPSGFVHSHEGSGVG